MNVKIFILLVVILVSAAAASVSAQKTPYYKPVRAEVVNAAEFTVMKPDRRIGLCRKSLKSCAFDAMATVGLEGFGGPETVHFFEHEFDYRQGGKRVGVFLFSILVREEDSPTDERTRVEFVRDGNAWRFVTVGQQTRCVNGKRITKWSKRNCR